MVNNSLLSTRINHFIMKKFILFFALFLVFSGSLTAQTTGKAGVQQKQRSGFGVKGGYNIARYTGSSPSFRPDTKNGFMAAAFYSPQSRALIGYRSELVFSRQGFGFDDAGKASSITSDYLYLPQFTTINITRFVQLQAGGQIGYLLRSSKQTAEETSGDITSLANRIDYGAAFGLELYPFKGLILGGRYNMSFGDTYKPAQLAPGIPSPLPFNPSDVKGKNAVINFFVGYRF